MKKNFKANIVLILFLAMQPYVIAQLNLDWIRMYNGPGNGADVLNTIAADDSGNIYVIGYSRGENSLYDYATIKYDSKGNQLWISRYNGPGNGEDKAVAICIDNAWNLYVTGSSKGSGNENQDFTTIKYNNSGDQLWISRYSSGTANDNAKAMCIDSTGNIYVTGESSIIRTVKYDSSGNQIWIRTYDGPSTGGNFVNDITSDYSGNLVLTGTSDSDVLTIKYSSSGDQLWLNTFNGTQNGSDYANAVTVDKQNNVYVTGKSYYYWITIKYSSSGSQLWTNSNLHYGESNDIANDLTVDDAGNVYVTGSSMTAVKTGSDITTVLYNYLGNLVWQKKFSRYYSGGSERGVKIEIYPGNSIIVLGKSMNNFVLLNYNQIGTQIWNTLYTTQSSADVPSGMMILNPGSIYISGTVTESGQSTNYALIKYSDVITNYQEINSTPEKFYLYQNYPNPFNPVTKISYELRVSSYASLKVYDILGKKISDLVNEKLTPGSYEVNFDGSNLPGGIYFYRLETENYSEVRRMILIK